MGGPQRFRAGDKIRSGPQVGSIAAQPPTWGVLNTSKRGTKSEGTYKWAGWLHNPTAWRVPNASEWGIKSELGHKWAQWPHNAPHGGSPTLLSGERNQKEPANGLGGYTTSAAWRVPNASERGTKTEVAHNYAGFLHNAYHMGGP